MSSPSPRAIPQPSESPEIVAWLSPDTLLANLRSAAEKATSEAERSKFGALVAKLEAELSRRSDTTVEGAKGAVADLKSIMNADDHSLAKRATDLATQAGDKIAPLAGATAREVKDVAGKALEAAKTGDLSEVKKLAEGVRETIAANGDKVLEYTGAAALSKMLEPIQKEWFAGIGAVLSNFWKLIAGIFSGKGFSISEVIGGTAGKAGQIKDAADAIKKDTVKAIPELTPVQKQEIKEASIASTKKWIEEKYFNGVELSSERAKSLIAILEKHKFPEEVIREKWEKWQKEWKMAVGDGLELLENYAFGNASVIFELLLSGVIPASKFAVSMIKNSVDAPQKHFALTLDGVGVAPATFGFDQLNAMVDSIGTDPQKKASLLYLLYKPAGLFASITGSMVAATASIWVSLLTNTTVDGIKMWKDVVRAHALGNYGPIISNFEILEQKLWVAGKAGSHMQELIRLQWLTQDIQKNYQLIQALEAEAKTPGALKNLAELDSIVGAQSANKIRWANSVDEMRALVTKSLKGSDTVDWFKSIGQDVQKLGGSGSARILEQADALNGILDTQKNLAARSNIGTRYFGALTDISKVATISRVQDTTMLMINRVEDLEQLSVTFAKLWAQGMKHLFNGVPLIGLGAGTYELLSQEKKTQVSTWMKMIASALSMPVAGVVLLSEVEISKTDGLTVENMGKGALWVTLLTGSGIYILKNPRSAVSFITGYSTLKTAWETLSAWVRGVRIVGAVVPKFGREIAATVWRMSTAAPGRAKLAAVVAAAWVGLAIYLWKSMGADPYETLVKENLIDPKSGELTAEFAKKFAALQPKAKKELLDAIVTSKLPPEIVNQAKTIFEPGSYTFAAPNKEFAKTAQLHLNDLQDQFAKNAVGLSEVTVTSES